MLISNTGKMNPLPVPDRTRMIRLVLASMVLVFGMAACTTESHSDLNAYVAEVKAKKPRRIQPLPEIKSYEPYAYNKEELRDPFKPPVEDRLVEASIDDGLQPDTERNREPLESFPLDSLQFVGHLERDGRVWAVINAPDKMVYRVEEGNYIGQSFGRIIRISESQISVQEIVPNGLGGWIERDATLMLVE